MSNGLFVVLDNKDVLFQYCENMEELYDKFYYPLLTEYIEAKKQKDKEIERLNNIIDELERHIKTITYYDIYGEQIIDSILNKLQELKGSDK